jgi:hypothetical protein
MVPLETFIYFTFYRQKCQTATYKKHGLCDDRYNITDDPQGVSIIQKVLVNTVWEILL